MTLPNLRLQHLEELQLERCGLQNWSNIAASLADCSQLTVLSLASNLLTEIKSDITLPSLRALNLDDVALDLSKLLSNPPAVFRQLSRLRLSLNSKEGRLCIQNYFILYES